MKLENAEYANLMQEIEARKALKSLLEDTLGALFFGIYSYVFRVINGKNHIHITFKNAAYKREWELKEKDFMEKMRTLYKERDLKKIVVFYGVQTSVEVAMIPPKQEIAEEKEQTYKEASTGNFKNYCTDPNLKELFEGIREKIKENLIKESAQC